MENIPEIPEHVKERSYQYRNIRNTSFIGWNQTGDKVLAKTRFSETYQLIEIDRPMGFRNQITFFAEPIISAAYSRAKNEKTILFSKDLGGNEVYQVFNLDQKTGVSTRLTDGNSRNGLGPISNSGYQFAFSSNRGNGKDMNIYICNMDGSGMKLLFQDDGYWIPLDWSPDDKYLLVKKYVSNYENYLYLCKIETGELREIGKGKKKIAVGEAGFSKDGSTVYYISDEDTEFQVLRAYDIGSGKSKLLTEDLTFNVESFTVSNNAKYLAFTINYHGYSKLYVKRIKGFKKVKIPEIPEGIISQISFNPDNERIGFTLQKSDSPSDIYSIDIDEKKLVRWTRSELGGLPSDAFIAPELIEYDGFDGLKIPAFYYKPAGEGSFPVVIYIHGGPESQHRPIFRDNIQYWVNELGLAVIAPNVRGSSGYGKTYQSLDNEFYRENSVKDIGSLLDHLVKIPEIDTSKVAVYGGSYGGYMVLASMFHYNDRIAAGVDKVGISSFVTFLKSTKSYRRDLRRMEYGDERHPEMRQFLEEISPLNNAEKIKKPIFIIQGLNDPRVPVTEAEQMRDMIRENGGDVWYLLAKDEGHGFKKKFNEDWENNATNLFFEKFLLEKH